MFYIAVFLNGQVSFPYSSKTSLETHNAFRLKQIYSIIQAESKEALNDKIKASLRGLK